MKPKDLMLIAALALLPFGVSAAGMQSSAQKTFKDLDTNHDGSISRTEAKSDRQLIKDWKSVDVNKDGKLEESEFSAFEVKQQLGGGHNKY